MLNTADLYTELDTNLAVAGLELSVSEVHGTLVGAIANHLRTGVSPDLLQLIEPQADAAESQFAPLHASIHQHHKQLSEQLFDSPEDFELMLPDDDEALSVRAEALAAWARGYLLGLLYNNAFSIDQLPESGPEIARDIMAIAELGETDDAGDRDDWALAELQEYVKVGVQLIFESIYTERATEIPAQQQ